MKEFILAVSAILFAVIIFSSCQTSVGETPEAQIPTITEISEDLTTAINDSVTLSVTAEVTDEGILSYQWYSADGKLSKGIAVESIENDSNGAQKSEFLPDVCKEGSLYYYCAVTNTLGTSKKTTISPRILLTIKACLNAAQPQITEQPSNLTKKLNEDYSFYVVASTIDGGKLSYQWYYSSLEDREGLIIDDGTSARLSGKMDINSSGYYYCVITNTLPDNGDGGTKTVSVQTERVQLSLQTVNASAPVIITEPVNISNRINDGFSFTVSATSEDKGSLSYQWYFSESENMIPNAIDGATNASFSGKISLTNLGYYYCIVTNTITDNGDGGAKTAAKATNKVILSYNKVNANLPLFSLQPQACYGKIGETVSFTVAAGSLDGGSLTYQWYYSSSEDGEGFAILGATSSKLDSKISLNNKNGYFYCVVTNTIADNEDGGKKSVSKASEKAKVSLIVINAAAPVITTQPSDATAVIPAEHTFTVGAYSPNGGTLSYQWYSIAENASTDTAMAIEGANSANYTITSSKPGKMCYYCVITNTLTDNGDGGKKSNSVNSATCFLEILDFTDFLELIFDEQPCKVNIAASDTKKVELTCHAGFESGYQSKISYRWYESTDGTSENGTGVTDGEGYNTDTYTTSVFTEKEIKYYYCVATATISKYDGTEISKTAVSDVVSVAYTDLPVVKIYTVNGEEPTADYVSSPAGCYGAGLKNATKPKARMQIFKANQADPIFDSGEYNKSAKTGLTIKLRGNTSAYSNKKPYKLKLQKKADLLADLLPNRTSKHKDKEWILLKDATSLNTFVGMAVADLAGTQWTPEFAFVNVVINDSYRGVYLLIEAITQNETRINVSENGYIIERDAYWWNEDIRFITTLYNQKYTFKYPDDEDLTADQLLYIENYMNTLEQHVKDDSYEECLDVESFARWLLIHDILGTWDSAGSNIYMSKYDSSDSKIYMSTTWDYDCIFQMKNSWARQHDENRIYASSMMISTNTAFKDSYKSQWATLSSSLWNDLSGKLDELNTAHGEDINLSRKCDAIRWGGNSKTVSEDIEVAQNWFTSRIDWLNTAINDL